jgi:hypothetical protein
MTSDQRAAVVKQLARDIDFAIDVTEPQDVRLRRFETVIEAALGVWPTAEQVEALTATLPGLRLAVSALREVQRAHRDPDSGDYNQCERGACAWCDDAEQALTALTTLRPPEDQ